MRTFREILESYGADYDSTMNRVMNSESMYLKLLDMFFADKSMDLLKEALHSGNLPEAFEAAHTLKGMTGNMGLTPLYDAVCILVEPLRRGSEEEDYLALYQDVEDEFQKVEILREALKETV